MSTNWKGYYAEKAVKAAAAPDRAAGYADLIGTISGISCSPDISEILRIERINYTLSCFFRALSVPAEEARATLVMKGGRHE